MRSAVACWPSAGDSPCSKVLVLRGLGFVVLNLLFEFQHLQVPARVPGNLAAVTTIVLNLSSQKTSALPVLMAAGCWGDRACRVRKPRTRCIIVSVPERGLRVSKVLRVAGIGSVEVAIVVAVVFVWFLVLSPCLKVPERRHFN